MKIVKAGFLLWLLCIINAGCKPAFTSVPDDVSVGSDLPSIATPSPVESSPIEFEESEQTEDFDLPYRVDIADGDSFTVLFKPKENMPEIEINFTLIGETDRGDPLPVHHHYFCSLRLGNELLQSFEITLIQILKTTHVVFQDIDFDGFLDMVIISISGSTNWPHDCFRFNPETGTFEEAVFFSTSGRGIKFFPDSKQAMVTIQDGHIPCIREILQYADGNYSHIRTEYINRDFKTGLYSISIVEYADNGEWTEIYSATLTEDEYDSDLTEWEVRENYLRFGMENAP